MNAKDNLCALAGILLGAAAASTPRRVFVIQQEVELPVGSLEISQLELEASRRERRRDVEDNLYAVKLATTTNNMDRRFLESDRKRVERTRDREDREHRFDIENALRRARFGW